MKHLTLKQIVRKWLENNGYDGLCNPERECGCKGSDLMVCCEPHELGCVAAKFKSEDEEAEVQGYEYIMVPAKPYDWKCTRCGERYSHSKNNGRWRGDFWMGSEMEHKCDDAHPQLGHVKAEPIWESD